MCTCLPGHHEGPTSVSQLDASDLEVGCTILLDAFILALHALGNGLIVLAQFVEQLQQQITQCSMYMHAVS